MDLLAVLKVSPLLGAFLPPWLRGHGFLLIRAHSLNTEAPSLLASDSLNTSVHTCAHTSFFMKVSDTTELGHPFGSLHASQALDVRFPGLWPLHNMTIAPYCAYERCTVFPCNMSQQGASWVIQISQLWSNPSLGAKENLLLACVRETKQCREGFVFLCLCEQRRGSLPFSLVPYLTNKSVLKNKERLNFTGVWARKGGTVASKSPAPRLIKNQGAEEWLSLGPGHCIKVWSCLTSLAQNSWGSLERR